MEGEGSADQTVVAAPVIAAVAIKAWPSARSAGLTRCGTGDAGGACFASGHPGQDNINQGPQDQAHRDGHTESYDQRYCEGKNASNRTFYGLCCSMISTS